MSAGAGPRPSAPPASPRVFVISGPSGVGKGTVVARLVERHPQVLVSVSATTRSARPGEIDGVSYHFLSDAEFEELLADDGLLEWALVHGSARYGTPRRPVDEAVGAGRVVILEIEIQGARQIRRSYPDAVHVFIAPPSWEELVHRLTGRGTETPEQQARRLETARQEMVSAGEFDHVLVNEDVDTTAAELAALIGLPPE